MPVYSAYGVGVESEYRFDALPVYAGSGQIVRLEIVYKEALPPAPSNVTHLGRAQGRNIYIVFNPDTTFLRVGAFASFALDTASGSILCNCLTVVPDELLRYWVLQHILPVFLLLNGTAEFLHGMAVSTGQANPGALAFVGDSHAGKSTLARYFLSRGHALIGDDHVAVSRGNNLDILPATPYYRPYRAGEDLGHIAAKFSSQPTPLRRLYLLEPTFGYGDIEAHALHGIQAIEAMLPHIQYNLHNPDLPQLFPLVAERFTGLNQLVRQVPIKRLYVPRDLNRLPEVYDFIQNDQVN